MAKHAPGCLFQKVTLWIAAPDYGDPSSEPVTHIVEAVGQAVDAWEQRRGERDAI
jgi:hypothetical protein